MPPTQSLLTLGSGPGCVHEARRWVALRCEDLGRAELTECAEAGVSELVTNALLHAEAPIQVSVTGTPERPRIEVRDASTEAPELPDLDDEPACDDEDLPLLTFGRGLGIVARSSRAWGADIQLGGKVVWFEPSDAMSEDRPPDGQITGVDVVALGAPAQEALLELALLAVPVPLLAEAMRHHRELRREVRLLALAHGTEDPLAHELSEVFEVLDKPLRAAKVVSHPGSELGPDGERAVDLRLRLPDGLPATLRRLAGLLERADDASHEGRLLTAPRDGAQQAFQRWFLLDLVAQARGADPTPWHRHRTAGS